VVFRRQQQAMGGLGGGLFGGGEKKKPIDPEDVRVTFDDVAGIDEVEAGIADIVDFLREPEKPCPGPRRATGGVSAAISAVQVPLCIRRAAVSRTVHAGPGIGTAALGGRVRGRPSGH
jgi:hypothetical protein